MAWQTELVGILRVMIGDLETPYKYSDIRLQKTIIAGAQRVIGDISDTGGVAYVSSFEYISITPDPTVSPKDDMFINLTLLASGCFVDQGAARVAARQGGFAFKEFASSLDLRGVVDAALKVLAVGWCKNYDATLFAYLAGNSSVGAAVMGPFRTIYSAYAVGGSGGYGFSETELFNPDRRG